MPRATYVFRNGRLVEKFGPEDVRPQAPRSHLPSPMLIRDEMQALRGMHDGKFYDSKSALRRSYKQAGVIELGNDAPQTPTDNRQPITKAEIGEALNKVRQGYKPAPLPSESDTSWQTPTI